MKGMIDQVEISIPCPDCGKRAKKSMKWVQSHDVLVCECGTSIDLDKAEETQATRRLRKSLKRIAKTFKPKYL